MAEPLAQENTEQIITSSPEPVRPASSDNSNIVGVTLDAYHPLGTPEPSQMGKIGWVHF